MCVFCNKIDKDRIILETTDWIAFYDMFPVSNGHTLIVPKKHYETFFDLSDNLKESLMYRINDVKNILDKKFNPDGYNIGCNCGEAAGQTVMHFHLHIIPRYNGDIDNPKGGIRGCVPSRMSY